MVDCSICLNEEIEQLDKCINNCGHIFCKSCLDTWLNRGNSECPLCRQKIEYFEYRSEKYRLINISTQTDRSINPVTIYRTNPKIIILLRIIGLITSVGFFIQAYFVYNLHSENNELKNEYENKLNIYKYLFNNVINVKINNNFNNYINCLVPKHFVDICFNT